MGCYASTSEQWVSRDGRNIRKRSEPICRKTLFLGLTHSGKSALWKAFYYLYCANKKDTQLYGSVDDMNREHTSMMKQCLYTIRTLLEARDMHRHGKDNMPVIDLPVNECKDEALDSAIQTFWRLDPGDVETINLGETTKTQLVNAMRYIWQTDTIQCTLQHTLRHNYEDKDPIPTNCEYFMEKVMHIFDDSYQLTTEDILRAENRRYSGLYTRQYELPDNLVLDINMCSGDRFSRRKWIYFFEGAQIIMYTASLLAYFQRNRDDYLENCMVHSLLIFEEICNREWFRNTPIVLLLTKRDLIKRYIMDIPLSVCFGDECKHINYDSIAQCFMHGWHKMCETECGLKIPNELMLMIGTYLADFVLDQLCVRSVEFIKQRYMKLVPHAAHNVYCGVVSLADIDNVRSVMQDVQAFLRDFENRRFVFDV